MMANFYEALSSRIESFVPVEHLEERESVVSSFEQIRTITEGCDDILPASFFRKLNSLERTLEKGDLTHKMLNAGLRELRVLAEIPLQRDRFASLASTTRQGEPTFGMSKEHRKTAIDLCTELTSLISESNKFDDAHKVRLLNRIKMVEVELHKTQGRFDVILGGVVDFGEALGTFGKDIKPLVDRMNEIRKLARSSSKQYEQIPPPEETVLLPPPDEE